MAKAAAQSAVAKEAGKKILLAGAGAVGNAGGGLATRRQIRRRNRKLAISLARQMQGQYSEDTIVAGEERYIVWLNGEPRYAFPPLDETQGELGDRPELQTFPDALRKDPPALAGG
jgi:hypothetical protein